MKLLNNRCPAASSTFALCALLFVLCGSVHAQQTDKVLRIGFLKPSTASGSAVLVDAFRQELSKLGWLEGKNITIEFRFAELKNERLPELAADLVYLKVDLIDATPEHCPDSQVGCPRRAAPGRVSNMLKDEGCHGYSMARPGWRPRRPAWSRSSARAVDEADRLSIYHRVFKPSNVLMMAGGNPKIVDFGLARAVYIGWRLGDGRVSGTPSYLAPEQAVGRGKAVARPPTSTHWERSFMSPDRPAPVQGRDTRGDDRTGGASRSRTPHADPARSRTRRRDSSVSGVWPKPRKIDMRPPVTR